MHPVPSPELSTSRRESVRIQLGDKIATIRTRDRRTQYEPEQAGLFREVVVDSIRLFDQQGAFIQSCEERTPCRLYRIAGSKEAEQPGDVPVVLPPDMRPARLVQIT